MDLISIAKVLWRHKLAVIPAILVTLIGLLYVLVIKPPAYQAQGSVLLINPPVPTSSEVNADPKGTSNPYVNYNNLTIVADILMNLVSSSTEQAGIVRAGANPNYQVQLSADVGTPPILAVTGTGPTAAVAILSSNLVIKAIETDLAQMQERQGVESKFRITTEQIVVPNQATATISSKLRTLVIVIVGGVLLLLVSVSVSETIERHRQDNKSTAALNGGSSEAEQPAVTRPSAERVPPRWQYKVGNESEVGVNRLTGAVTREPQPFVETPHARFRADS